MAKKNLKAKSKPKKEKKKTAKKTKKTKTAKTAKTTKTTKTTKETTKTKKKRNIQKTETTKNQIKNEKNHHKFILCSALGFDDILSKVIPLRNGKYGVLNESGDFIIFTINEKKEMVIDLSFQFLGSNLFCQLGNGIFVFNSFNYISFWELEGKKMNKLGEYKTIFGLVTYFMEPINDNFCAISGPNDIIEIIQFDKKKKNTVTYLDYKKSKSRHKKNENPLFMLSAEGVGCLYYQKKNNRLLASYFNNKLRVWNCDFSNNKYELFKEIEDVTNFKGKIIHELNNKILVGGKDVITILNNDIYEIIDFVDLGNYDYDIFSMEVIKYYNFKEFVVCGLRNGRILGVDIGKKKIEFNKKKINDTGKDNEINFKDGKVTFYGENISYITKVDNTNMILVASHDHTLKLFEY